MRQTPSRDNVILRSSNTVNVAQRKFLFLERPFYILVPRNDAMVFGFNSEMVINLPVVSSWFHFKVYIQLFIYFILSFSV